MLVVLDAISGYDEMDPTSLSDTTRSRIKEAILKRRARNKGPLRIGVPLVCSAPTPPHPPPYPANHPPGIQPRGTNPPHPPHLETHHLLSLLSGPPHRTHLPPHHQTCPLHVLHSRRLRSLLQPRQIRRPPLRHTIPARLGPRDTDPLCTDEERLFWRRGEKEDTPGNV